MRLRAWGQPDPVWLPAVCRGLPALAVLIALWILSGCSHEPPYSAISGAERSVSIIKSQAINAGQHLTIATQPSDLNIPPELLQHVSEANAIVSQIPGEADGVQQDLDSTQKQLQQDDQKITQLNAKINDKDAKIFLDFEIFGALGIVAGIVTTILGTIYLGTLGRNIGIAIGVGGFALVIVGIAIPTLQKIIPWVVVVIVIIAFAAGIWMIWKKRAAIEELVETGQATKQVMSPAQRTTIFSNGALTDGSADAIQSSSTQAMVANVRKSGAVTPVPSVPSSAATTVPVTFNLIFPNPPPGQALYVYGDASQLGTWTIIASCKLSGTSPVWSATVSLPIGKPVQYKYALVNGADPPQAESGNNRSFTPTPPSDTRWDIWQL